MIITHSDVLEYLRKFMEGRKLNGYNELGAWYDLPGTNTTRIAPWAEIEEWACRRDRREHCQLDADNDRDEEEGEKS